MAAPLGLGQNSRLGGFPGPGFSEEMFTVFSKIGPFLNELRNQSKIRASWPTFEKIIARPESAR
jgi:hypothetical protein